MDATIAAVGAVVGTIVGLTSTGGGTILTPALILVAGVPPSLVVGTNVLVAGALKAVGGGAYSLRGQVHWETVVRLATGSIPGAALGVFLLNLVPKSLVDGFILRALGVALVLAGAATLTRFLLKRKAPPEREPGWIPTLLLGLVIGTFVSVTTVGSGSLLIVAMTFFYPLRAAQLVGTNLAHATVVTASSALAHFFWGQVDWSLMTSVLAGGVPGVLLGVQLGRVLPDRALRGALAASLIGVGLFLSTGGKAPRATTPSPVATEVKPLPVSTPLAAPAKPRIREARP